MAAYLSFDKSKLVNLSYSLERELLRSNRMGSYSCLSIIRSNTRKYHGLLVTPQQAVDNELHVLLSSLDPTIIQQGASFNLGIHQYAGGAYSPKGHKYVYELGFDPIPFITYRVGGVIFKLEAIFSSTEDRIMFKYTLLEANSQTTIQLKPYLAFRQRHCLSKANEFVNTQFKKSQNGVSFKLYKEYTPLYIQASKQIDYTHSPNWYYNIEYFEERNRGYECNEDLMVPGYFEFKLEKGESIIVSAGTTEVDTNLLNTIYEKELKSRIRRDSFKDCLKNAAQQFIAKRKEKTEIIAGFPWYSRKGRDTFISLPGLVLLRDEEKQLNQKLFKEILNSIIAKMSGPLFPNVGYQSTALYNTADTSLWFFWTLQQYILYGGTNEDVWNSWGETMKMILRKYREGTSYNIKILDNGLVYSGEKGFALTWMDSISNGEAVTSRIGFAVEINALAYNAICFTLELAKEFNDTKFIDEFSEIANNFKENFTNTFWNDQYNYLADYVNGDYKDWSIRPNMLLAISLPYSPVKKEYMKAILDVVEAELLTTRGLRTLSPNHSQYESNYFGDQNQREIQCHQGTVFPWLFGSFVEVYLKIKGLSGLRKIKWYLEQFEETITEHGIGSISEMYDGSPPHQPRGAISQAVSVAEILRSMDIIARFEQQER